MFSEKFELFGNELDFVQVVVNWMENASNAGAICITYEGALIPKKNNPILCMSKMGKPYIVVNTKKVKQAASAYSNAARNQYTGKPLNGAIFVIGVLYFSDYRIRDVSNVLENVYDALQGIVYYNDVQLHFRCIIRSYRKESGFDLRFIKIDTSDEWGKRMTRDWKDIKRSSKSLINN